MDRWRIMAGGIVVGMWPFVPVTAAAAEPGAAAAEEKSATNVAAIDAAERPTIELRLMDTPDVWRTEAGWPSFAGAVSVGASVERLGIYGLQRGMFALFPENEGLRTGLGMGLAGAASFGIRFVGAWTHEEAHRAVMRNRGISSRNGLYYPSAWSNGTIAVDHVSEGELAGLKTNHPADTVRLMSAGIEAQHLLVRQVGDLSFFGDEQGTQFGPLHFGETWMAPTMVMENLSTIFYYAQCASPSSDRLTAAENQRAVDVQDRDFTGLDCTAWVYDMRRPDEPYAFRGAHPVGVGVDRYRSWSDLSREEQRWLKGQAQWNLLNLANPHLLGINAFLLADGGRWMVQGGHLPTPWGGQVAVRGAYRKADLQLEGEVQANMSGSGVRPGLRGGVRALPVGERFRIDLSGGFWLQPAEQRWDAETMRPGGFLRGDLRVPLGVAPQFSVMPGVLLKSEGFMGGVVHLDPMVQGTLGLAYQPAD